MQGPFEDELLFHQDGRASGRQIFAQVGIFSRSQFVFRVSEPVSPDYRSAAVTHKFLAFVYVHWNEGEQPAPTYFQYNTPLSGEKCVPYLK